MLTMQAFYEKLVEALPGAEPHYAILARVTRLEPESVTTLADGRTWHSRSIWRIW